MSITDVPVYNKIKSYCFFLITFKIDVSIANTICYTILFVILDVSIANNVFEVENMDQQLGFGISPEKRMLITTKLKFSLSRYLSGCCFVNSLISFDFQTTDNFFIYQLSERQKILGHAIRMKKSPQTRSHIFWIFTDLHRVIRIQSPICIPTRISQQWLR